MRRVRYVVAMSLDGYIAGPNGEADWIIMDPDIDFHGLFDQFDTFLLDAIAAVVIGGTSLFGGRGGIGNTIIGLLYCDRLKCVGKLPQRIR